MSCVSYYFGIPLAKMQGGQEATFRQHESQTKEDDMNTRRSMTFLKKGLAITITLFAFGCAGSQVKPTLFPEGPSWVQKGAGAFLNEQKQPVFYAVGTVSGVRNSALAIATADNRARNEIAKVFEVYVSSLMKDYAAATTAGDFTASSEEQHIEQALKTVTAMTLNGVMIVDHWKDTETQAIFSLAKLDLEAFKENLNQMKELNQQVKEHVLKNADRLHEELKKEEEKVKG
jgi:hypothetical protein